MSVLQLLYLGRRKGKNNDIAAILKRVPKKVSLDNVVHILLKKCFVIVIVKIGVCYCYCKDRVLLLLL